MMLDGFLDLIITNTAKWTYQRAREATNYYYRGTANYWDLPKSPMEHNVLYHNNGNGTFTKVKDSGLAGPGWGGDVAVFDYDNDGYLDVLVTNMFGSSQLYRNNYNGTLLEVTQKVLGKNVLGAIGAKVFDQERRLARPVDHRYALRYVDETGTGPARWETT